MNLGPVFTPANQLTLLRMLLIPFFVILVIYGYRGWALVTFLTAGVTDLFDGLIAPTQHVMDRITGGDRDPHPGWASFPGCIQDLFKGDQFRRFDQAHAFRLGDTTEEALCHELLNLLFNKGDGKLELDGQLRRAKRALPLHITTSQGHQQA